MTASPLPPKHYICPMTMDADLIEKALPVIEESEKIVVTCHVNPDGDAIGSSLGLAQMLKSMGKQVNVVVPNDFAINLRWMEGAAQILVHEKQTSKANELAHAADLTFHLDYNALKRAGSMEELLGKIQATRINIDHHQQPDNFADFNFSDPAASSTSEMIYQLASAWNILDHLNVGGAECLYAGIITDTGNFRFSSTGTSTHLAAANLLMMGVRPDKVAGAIYDTNRPERLKLLSRALDRMEVLPEYRTALITLEEKDLEEFNFQRGDTEGFVNYGLSIKGIDLAAFFYPRDGRVKMSFRGSGVVDVNQVARQYFNGGGHVNAAGGISTKSLEECVQDLKAVLPEIWQKAAL